MRTVLLSLACFVLAGAACPHDDCTPAETRCFENRAQICGSDQRWRVFEDCEEIGGVEADWTCCWQPGNLDEGIPEGHTCLPGCECPADDVP